MNKTRSSKEAKLNTILDAATKILVEKPTASLNDIADYAGIGIATLHRYIENREQLML
ncbi:TetR/AcrR family transcriptional regulator, partial [Paenibacillus sp. E194]